MIEGLCGAENGVEADDGFWVVARTPVVVAPVDGVHDADADLLAGAPCAEVGVGLRGFELHFGRGGAEPD